MNGRRAAREDLPVVRKPLRACRGMGSHDFEHHEKSLFCAVSQMASTAGC